MRTLIKVCSYIAIVGVLFASIGKALPEMFSLHKQFKEEFPDDEPGQNEPPKQDTHDVETIEIK